MPHRSLLVALFFAASAAGLGFTCKSPFEKAPETAPPLPKLSVLERPVSFEADVKPVLDGRCVVCHACYDAPCQLQLGSDAGVARGASKQVVYDTARLSNAEPTRLGIDAHGAEAWRAKGFHPVLDDADPARSLLVRMLALGAGRPFAAGERLPASIDLNIDRPLSCATGEEFDAYARTHPDGGMPYGTAPLSKDELGVLASWLAQGAPAPAPSASADAADTDVAIWEKFLNGPSLKQRIMARYLYEHWFVAHLVFDDRPTGPFFRVVRSRT